MRKTSEQAGDPPKITMASGHIERPNGIASCALTKGEKRLASLKAFTWTCADFLAGKIKGSLRKAYRERADVNKNVAWGKKANAVLEGLRKGSVNGQGYINIFQDLFQEGKELFETTKSVGGQEKLLFWMDNMAIDADQLHDQVQGENETLAQQAKILGNCTRTEIWGMQAIRSLKTLRKNPAENGSEYVQTYQGLLGDGKERYKNATTEEEKTAILTGLNNMAASVGLLESKLEGKPEETKVKSQSGQKSDIKSLKEELKEVKEQTKDFINFETWALNINKQIASLKESMLENPLQKGKGYLDGVVNLFNGSKEFLNQMKTKIGKEKVLGPMNDIAREASIFQDKTINSFAGLQQSDEFQNLRAEGASLFSKMTNYIRDIKDFGRSVTFEEACSQTLESTQSPSIKEGVKILQKCMTNAKSEHQSPKTLLGSIKRKNEMLAAQQKAINGMIKSVLFPQKGMDAKQVVEDCTLLRGTLRNFEANKPRDGFDELQTSRGITRSIQQGFYDDSGTTREFVRSDCAEDMRHVEMIMNAPEENKKAISEYVDFIEDFTQKGLVIESYLEQITKKNFNIEDFSEVLETQKEFAKLYDQKKNGQDGYDTVRDFQCQVGGVLKIENNKAGYPNEKNDNRGAYSVITKPVLNFAAGVSAALLDGKPRDQNPALDEKRLKEKIAAKVGMTVDELNAQLDALKNTSKTE